MRWHANDGVFSGTPGRYNNYEMAVGQVDVMQAGESMDFLIDDVQDETATRSVYLGMRLFHLGDVEQEAGFTTELKIALENGDQPNLLLEWQAVAQGVINWRCSTKIFKYGSFWKRAFTIWTLPFAFLFDLMQSSVFTDCVESRCLQSQRSSSDYGISVEGNVGITLFASKFPPVAGRTMYCFPWPRRWLVGRSPPKGSRWDQFFSRGCVKGAYLEISLVPAAVTSGHLP